MPQPSSLHNPAGKTQVVSVMRVEKESAKLEPEVGAGGRMFSMMFDTGPQGASLRKWASQDLPGEKVIYPQQMQRPQVWTHPVSGEELRSVLY